MEQLNETKDGGQVPGQVPAWVATAVVVVCLGAAVVFAWWSLSADGGPSRATRVQIGPTPPASPAARPWTPPERKWPENWIVEPDGLYNRDGNLVVKGGSIYFAFAPSGRSLGGDSRSNPERPSKPKMRLQSKIVGVAKRQPQRLKEIGVSDETIQAIVAFGGPGVTATVQQRMDLQKEVKDLALRYFAADDGDRAKLADELINATRKYGDKADECWVEYADTVIKKLSAEQVEAVKLMTDVTAASQPVR